MKKNQRARKSGPRGSLTNRESIARAVRFASSIVARAALIVIVKVVIDRLLR